MRSGLPAHAGDVRLILPPVGPDEGLGTRGAWSPRRSPVDELTGRERLSGLLGPRGPRRAERALGGNEEERVFAHGGVERALGNHRRVGLSILREEGLAGVEVPEPQGRRLRGQASHRVGRQVAQRDVVPRELEIALGVPADDERLAGLQDDRLHHPCA